MTVSLGPGSPVVAIDVGGTGVKAALIDHDGTIAARAEHRAPAPGPESAQAVVALAAEITRTFADRFPALRPAAVGLVVPGVVDDEAGIGVFSENLGWREFGFRAAAAERLGMPVAFGHDVRAAGVAEFRLGAAREFATSLVVTIGTGISATVFVDGRLYAGRGFAGEIGHARVADGPPCVCGGVGCLEAVASAAAIARRYNELAGDDLPGAREVIERVRAGDAAAEHVWSSALDALALGLSHAVALLAPDGIVLGGGLIGAGDELFLQPLAQRLGALLTYQRMPALLPARFGADAGTIGAALLARDLIGAR